MTSVSVCNSASSTLQSAVVSALAIPTSSVTVSNGCSSASGLAASRIAQPDYLEWLRSVAARLDVVSRATNSSGAVNVQFTVFATVPSNESSADQSKLASLLSESNLGSLHLPSGAGAPVPPATPTPIVTSLPNNSPLPTNKVVLPDSPTIYLPAGSSATCAEILSAANTAFYNAFSDVPGFSPSDVVVGSCRSSAGGGSMRWQQPLLRVEDDGMQTAVMSAPRKGSLRFSYSSGYSFYVACTVGPQYVPPDWQERMYQAVVLLQTQFVTVTTTVVTTETITLTQYETVTDILLAGSTSIIYQPVQLYPRRVSLDTSFYCSSVAVGVTVLTCTDIHEAILNACDDIGIPSTIVNIHECTQVDTYNVVVRVKIDTFSTYTTQYSYAIRDTFVNNYFWERVQLYQPLCGGGQLHSDIVEYTGLNTASGGFTSTTTSTSIVQVVTERPNIGLTWFDWQWDCVEASQLKVWTCDEISVALQNTIAGYCGLYSGSIIIRDCECLSSGSGESVPSGCSGLSTYSDDLVNYGASTTVTTSTSITGNRVPWYNNRITGRVMTSVFNTLTSYSVLTSTFQTTEFRQAVVDELVRVRSQTTVTGRTAAMLDDVAVRATTPNISLHINQTKNTTAYDFLGKPTTVSPLFGLVEPSRLYDLNGSLCVSSCRPPDVSAANATTATCCSGNGACVNGICYCVPGFTGLLCQATPTPAAASPAALPTFAVAPTGVDAVNVLFQMANVSYAALTNTTRQDMFVANFTSAVRFLTNVSTVNVSTPTFANGTLPTTVRASSSASNITTGALQVLAYPSDAPLVRNLMSVLFLFGQVRAAFPPNGTVTAVSVQ